MLYIIWAWLGNWWEKSGLGLCPRTPEEHSLLHSHIDTHSLLKTLIEILGSMIRMGIYSHCNQLDMSLAAPCGSTGAFRQFTLSQSFAVFSTNSAEKGDISEVPCLKIAFHFTTCIILRHTCKTYIKRVGKELFICGILNSVLFTGQSVE